MDTTARLVCSFVATFDERVGEFSLIVRFLLVSLITSPNHQHSPFFETAIQSFKIERKQEQWRAFVRLQNVSDNMGVVISDPPQVSPSVPRWN